MSSSTERRLQPGHWRIVSHPRGDALTPRTALGVAGAALEGLATPALRLDRLGHRSRHGAAARAKGTSRDARPRSEPPPAGVAPPRRRVPRRRRQRHDAAVVLIYLHRVRGIEIEVAGLALVSLAAAGIRREPARRMAVLTASEPRRTLSAASSWRRGRVRDVLVREHRPRWRSLPRLLGLGAAVVWPSQDALLASLAARPPQRRLLDAVRDDEPRDRGRRPRRGSHRRHRLRRAPSSVVRHRGGRVRGFRRGRFAAARSRAGAQRRGRAVTGADWRTLLADRALCRLLPIVVLLFAAGYAQYYAGFPAYAAGTGRLGVSALGVVFAANTATIVVAQLVVLRSMARWSPSGGLACSWRACGRARG